ncbi:MAG TPA: hypothetical protein VME46_03970 [Acidimicrobiales bacterium]|nr:hypothetical protein [Acidimicrobiales bacterium]
MNGPRRAKPTLIGLAAALVAVSTLAAPALATTAPLGPASPGAPCAWPVFFNVHNSQLLGLDSSAAYWDQPIVASEATRITVSGTYPDAAYFSLQTYTPYASPFSVKGVSSSLADYQVTPQPGSTNPWQQRAAPGGRFQVTVRLDVVPGEANELPFPAGTSPAHPGYLVYRVYLPAGGTFTHVKPPTLTVANGPASGTLPTCRTHEPLPVPKKAPAGTTPPPPKVPPPAGAFFTPALSTYRSALADANDAYVGAYVIRPAPTDVLVVSAKAPTFPPGVGPSPWPAPGEDMQYWSMCIILGKGSLPTVANQLPGGQVDYGCRADEATKIDASGYYHYVIGSEAQRAVISRVAGATFLPYSSSQTTPRGRPWPLYLLLLRNVLVSPDFAHSAQKVARADDPRDAAAAMGTYYPRVSTCSLAALTTKGLKACGS